MDFSNARFSLNGNFPDLLPYRLRLSSGETRYVYDISLEEIYQCGYTGPHELPEVGNDKIAEWDSNALEYKVRDKTTDEFKTYQEHLDALLYIELLLLEEVEIVKNFDQLTEQYIKVKSLCFDKIKELKNLNNTLTTQYVKNIESEAVDSLEGITLYKTKKELLAACEEYVFQNKEMIKNTYETYGIVEINPCFYDVFKVDSSWVKGTEPYPWALPKFFLDFRPSA